MPNLSLFNHIKEGITDTCYICVKEMRGVVKDEGVLIFCVFLPLIYPLLYSWIYNNEVVHDVPVAVIDRSHSATSREFLRHLDATSSVKVAYYCDALPEAKELTGKQQVHGTVYFPDDFETRLFRGEQATVGVYTDMSLILTYKAIFQAAQEVATHMNSKIQVSQTNNFTDRDDEVATQPLAYEEVPIFNTTGGYGNALLPAVLMLILQQTLLLGIGLAAGTARENNRYQDLVPISKHYAGILRIVLGKSLCYFTLYMVMGTYLALVVPHLFSFTSLATFETLAGLLVPYILACIFFGMIVSSVMRYRENVLLLVIFTSIPLLFLTGASWPQSSIPPFWESFSWLFPSTFGVRGFLRISSMGATLNDIRVEYQALWTQVLIYFVLACAVYRYQIISSRRRAHAQMESLKRKVTEAKQRKISQSGSAKTLIVIAISTFALCAQANPVLPTPQHITAGKGQLTWNTKHTLKVYADARCLDLLTEKVLPGVATTAVADSGKADIVFWRNESLSPESYQLRITRKGITVEAADYAGWVYAIQTLSQWKQSGKAGQPVFPCAHITDRPLMGWRGFMLDSGRQYQPLTTIKRCLDLMGMLKMNRFHWHLTEGLGWRLPVEAYPKLTSVGAFVGQGEGQQGYYSREDIKEVIAYAARLGIMVIPEVDLPGHSEAALTAYPQYTCFGTRPVIPTTGFTPTIFCAGKDSVMAFLKDVLGEVCQLFPGQYIHLGGDEAPKDNWDRCPDCQRRMAQQHLRDSHGLQMWMAAELAKYVAEKGKTPIFYGDVVVRDGYALPQNAIVEWWNYRNAGDTEYRQAVKHGLQVIGGTNYYNYLNFPLEPWKGYGKERTFGLKEAYTQNPSYQAFLAAPEKMKGMECMLWTDYGLQPHQFGQRLMPRILALAQQMWHVGPLPHYAEFEKTIQTLKPFFASHGW